MKENKKIKTVDTSALYGVGIIVLLAAVWIAGACSVFEFLKSRNQNQATAGETFFEEIVYEVTLPEHTTEIKNEQPDEVSFEEPVDFPPTKLIDVPYINQKKNYPTGCEPISAVMALRHLGYKISGKYFITHFLSVAPAPFVDEAGKSMGYDPREYFLGNPFSENGWGCMAPVIEKALIKCIDHSKHEIKNLTGTPLNELKSYIDRDIPVIIWGTQGMAPTRVSRTWAVVGTEGTYTWISPNHCLLLVGYDDTGYYFNDPLTHKNCRYPADIVNNRYISNGMQAIVITEKTEDGEYTEPPQEDPPVSDNVIPEDAAPADNSESETAKAEIPDDLTQEP